VTTVDQQMTHAAQGQSDTDMLKTRPPNVAILIVTWNRWNMAATVLRALSKQTFPTDRLDVVVIDNASTDGTTEHLREAFSPEMIVTNPTAEAHVPDFRVPEERSGRNRLGFRSLSLVQNSHNHGGCGGFNTGFAFVDRVLARKPVDERPDYVWLVDDDVDLPVDAAEQLTRVAEGDHSIGLVGSRTVDINNRDTTIETTVYYHRSTGLMGDEPDSGHPLRESHLEWVRQTGGVRGSHSYSGTRDVDVVSACSMLARWSAVEKVGFWDWRYFIYCDDADWCLRFAKEGYRVVLNLDAVVYHTPWHHKLTPARLYYAQRNVIWMNQKVLEGKELRRVIGRRLGGLLKDSLVAGVNRRLSHAEVIRRTADDVCSGLAGKLNDPSPAFEPTVDALVARGLLDPAKQIAVLCNRPECFEWSRQLRDSIDASLAAAGRAGQRPRWLEVVRNDVPEAETRPGAGDAQRAIYSRRRRSKLRRQTDMFKGGPHALVIFDNDCDFPLLRSGVNVHVDRRRDGECQVEPCGLRVRMGFAGRWVLTALRCGVFMLTLAPFKRAGRYG
jgi:GT2 family glycosyltransferase